MSDKHEPRLTGYKVCSRCEVEQPVINFGVDKHNKDGLNGVCRACKSYEERTKRRHRKPRGVDDIVRHYGNIE